MNTLPKVLEDIILYHQKFLDHQERNKNILRDIKEIEHRINHHGDTWREMNGHQVQYYGGLNRANKWRDSAFELWVHRYTTEDDETPEKEEVKIIIEECDYIDVVNS